MNNKNKIGDLENICTNGADRERFLCALRRLSEAGVTLIDDKAGHPRVIGKVPERIAETPIKIQSTEDLILDQLETMFELQDNADCDPYNSKP